MPFVIDASITASRLLSDELHPRAVAAFERLIEDSAVAPAIWWFEVRNMLVMNERRGRITVQRVTDALTMLDEIPVSIDRQIDSREVVALARTHRLSVYDAAYLELAIRRNFPLATLDEALTRAAGAMKVSLLV